MDVAGALIEALSGQRLDDFLEERIFAPLGMVDTGFFVPAPKYHRLSSLWMDSAGATYMAPVPDAGDHNKGTPAEPVEERKRGLTELDFRWSKDPETRRRTPVFTEQVSRRPSLLSGGDGLCGTAHDFGRFCEMLMHGGRVPGGGGKQILSSHTLRFMRQNHLVKDGKPVGFDELAVEGYTEATAQSGAGFGIGFSVIMDQALTRQPDSVGTFSWSGAASTNFICDPAENLFVVFMTALRFRDDRILPLKPKLLQHVYACIADDPQATGPAEADARESSIPRPLSRL